jgi:hypothetical protein
MPQPVHLPGSTETYFRELDLAVCICFTVDDLVSAFFCECCPIKVVLLGVEFSEHSFAT